MNSHSIDVSVIVTTRNEGLNLRNCLESVQKQNYPWNRIEIIVVDNQSTDRTLAIANRFTDKVYNKGPERSCQRNFGVKHSDGKYILYLDADMILSQNVIKECFDKCENSDCIALYITERIIGKGFWIKVRDFERSFYNGTCIDCVRFVRKDKFLESGGFDENLTGTEDWDFDRRINTLGITGIVADSIYHNERVIYFRQYTAKKCYYAKSFNRYIAKWGRNDRIIKKQFGISYRFLGVFVENGKWVKLITHPLLSFGMFFLRFLVGVGYLVTWRKMK